VEINSYYLQTENNWIEISTMGWKHLLVWWRQDS